ncbi:MAG: hypothetical protein JNK04_11830, partial [Myxococcales bacterium]|nr:hypothetical protein [Myxococcales bacterium]
MSKRFRPSRPSGRLLRPRSSRASLPGASASTTSSPPAAGSPEAALENLEWKEEASESEAPPPVEAAEETPPPAVVAEVVESAPVSEPVMSAPAGTPRELSAAVADAAVDQAPAATEAVSEAP